jgi:hypothetical protein
VIIGVAVGILVLTTRQTEDARTPEFRSAISLVVHDLVPVADPDGDYVAVLLSATDSSGTAWERLQIQLEMRNEAGDTVDTWMSHDYDVVVPPNGDVRFRVLRSAIRPLEEYAAADALVVSASRFSQFGR